MKMPNRIGSSYSSSMILFGKPVPTFPDLALIRQRTAAGFAGRKGCGQRNDRKNNHHDRDAAGTAEISGERSGEDRCEAAADRRRDLEAERRTAVAHAGAEQFREVAR